MTKEQAYEKLELPIDTDLQVVRQKFQQMHNDFQVQIDGAFNESMRRRKEQQLEELKEAYAVLNKSESMDDSASLPRTEKTFDQTSQQPYTESAPSAASGRNKAMTLPEALALFGLAEQQDVASIEQTIVIHLADLRSYLSAAPLQAAKDLYKKEIDKAESANSTIAGWLTKRKQAEEQEKKAQAQHQKGQTASVTVDEENNKNIKRWNAFIFILFLSSMGLLFIELLLNGRIEVLLVYAIGVIIISAIILNHYAPMLVPPALRKDYFRGKGAWKGLFYLMLIVLGLGVLTVLFKLSGLSATPNSTLRIVCSMIYLLIMVGGGILGLINPKIIFFKNRGDVLKALIAMPIAHLFICLVIGMLLFLPSTMLSPI